MNNYIQKLKSSLSKNGISQAKFAESIGFSRGLVSDVLNEKVKPSKRFVRLSNSFFESLGHDGVKRQKAADAPSVPILSWQQAERLTEGSGSDVLKYADELLQDSAGYSENAFALRIEDDTMVPEFSVGEIIIVDPNVKPYSGCCVVVRVGKDSATTFKQLVVDGGRTFLKPYNERYPISDVTDVVYQILGVVVQKVKWYLKSH